MQKNYQQKANANITKKVVIAPIWKLCDKPLPGAISVKYVGLSRFPFRAYIVNTAEPTMKPSHVPNFRHVAYAHA